MRHSIELGLDTFGDVTAGADGRLLSHAQVIRNVIEEAVLADRIGIDFFGVGEHHRRVRGKTPQRNEWTIQDDGSYCRRRHRRADGGA